MGNRKTAGGVGTSDRVSSDFGEAVPAISYVWQTPARRPGRQPDAPPDVIGRGGGLSPTDRARLERIVARAHEVMIKITGRTKGVEHLQSHLAYIMRNGDLAAETERGAILAGGEGLRDLQARWGDDVTLDRRRRADASLSVNMILSMPPGTDAIKVRDAVRAFAIETFEGRHDYVLVLHLDDEHPHVHLTVRSLGYDGRRLNPRKGDLVEWRERFAAELRLREVEAEATPRRARGKVRKAERGPLRAMRERGVVPRVEQAARESVLCDIADKVRPARPWEAKTLERRDQIRSRYQAAARDSAGSGDPADRALAARIEAFLADMTTPILRRQALRKEFARYAESVTDRKDRESRAEGDRKEGREGPER